MHRSLTCDEKRDAFKAEADASAKAFLDHLASRAGSGVAPKPARLAAYGEKLLTGPADPRLKEHPRPRTVVRLQNQWLRDRPRQVEYLMHQGKLVASLVELESRADQAYLEALEGGVHQAIAAGLAADVKRLPTETAEPRLPKEKAPYGQARAPRASQHPWPVTSTRATRPV